MKILLVEDDDLISDMISESLRDHGVNVIPTPRVSIARTLAAKTDFDVAIFDLKLLDSTPEQTLARLPEFVEKMAVIVLSGADSDEVAVECAKIGAFFSPKDQYSLTGDRLYRQIKVTAAYRKREDRLRELANEQAEQALHLETVQERFFQTTGETFLQRPVGNLLVDSQRASNQILADLLTEIRSGNMEVAGVKARQEVLFSSMSSRLDRLQTDTDHLNRIVFEDADSLQVRVGKSESFRRRHEDECRRLKWTRAKIWVAVAAGSTAVLAAMINLIREFWPKK